MPGALDAGPNLDAIRALEGLGTRTDPAARAAVGREFEALLIGEITKGANRPVFGESLLSGGSAGEMWREMFLEQVVRAGAGRFGVADALWPSEPDVNGDANGDANADAQADAAATQAAPGGDLREDEPVPEAAR